MIDEHHATPSRLPDAIRLHPRLVLAAVIVSVLMLPVGAFTAALGVWVLEMSGGAARDTSIVVAMAGFLVSDFWGGGIVTTVTRARPPQVAAAWAIGRLIVLAAALLVAPALAIALPFMLVAGAGAAYAGSRVARKQAALRRLIADERAAEPVVEAESKRASGAVPR